MAKVLQSVTPLTSGDGERRYRVVWRHKKWSYYASIGELRELAGVLIQIIKEEKENGNA